MASETGVADVNSLPDSFAMNNQPQPLNHSTEPEILLSDDVPTKHVNGAGDKKSKRNPENWKQTIRKRLRQSGQKYVNANGDEVAERKVRSGCGATCHLKCSERIFEEQRQHLHRIFWHLTDEQKNMFYWKYTSRATPKRRRNPNNPPKRLYTFHYQFELRGEIIPVCGKFFFATLDIAPRRIYYFYENCYDENACMPSVLTQVKVRKSNRSVGDLKEGLNRIRKHIGSFPAKRLPGVTKKRYLSTDLSLDHMYLLYTQQVENPLKHHWYARIFYKEFNLGFLRKNSTKEKSTSTKNTKALNDEEVKETSKDEITPKKEWEDE